MKLNEEKFMIIILMILFSCIATLVVAGTLAALIGIAKLIF